MGLGAEGVLWVQGWSNPALDLFFRGITFLGEGEFLILLIPLLFWIVDKRVGARVGILYLASVVVNEALKLLFGHPRPFESGIRFLVEAPGPFGFPSGHAQGTVVTWGCVAWSLRSRRLGALASALAILVSLSRVYLGVHYPGDVLGGVGVGIVLLVVFALFSPQVERALGSWPWGARLAMAALPLIPAVVLPQPNVVAAMGGLVGLGAGFTLEERWVSFRPCRVRREPWRILGATAMAAALYFGLKAWLPAGEGFRLARYAALGFYGGFVGPWVLFRLRDGLGEAKTPEPSEAL